MKKIIVVGATSAMAEHCMRLWVKEPVELFMAGRDQTKLEAVAADLKVRQPQAKIHLFAFDFKSLTEVSAFVNAAYLSGPVSIALIAHGYLGEQSACQQNLELCQYVLEVTGISPVLFAEAIAQRMDEAGEGRLAVIGSVAGDRGRKSNYIYGAAKGLVERYVEGLQHRFALKKNIHITLIKPGPTATPMTHLLQAQSLSMASVQDVSKQIVHAIEKGTRVVYTPKKWGFIMRVLKHLPAFVFERLEI